jgi:hypothetical protein
MALTGRSSRRTGVPAMIQVKTGQWLASGAGMG